MNDIIPRRRRSAFPTTSVVGVAIGLVLSAPVYVAVSIMASPVVDVTVGDGVSPTRWGLTLRAPWRQSPDRACWQMAFNKLYTARPVALDFYVVTGLNSHVPISVHREDYPFDPTVTSRPYMINHEASDPWANTYCTVVTDDIDTPRGFVIAGVFSFTRWRLLGIEQPMPAVQIPPRQ